MLSRELEGLENNSSGHHRELEKVKVALTALEEQTVAATEHLDTAYSQIVQSQSQLKNSERTLGFLKEVFQVLAQEHDPDTFSCTMVQWFCECFELERCSLMLLDSAQDTLSIAAQQGIAPEVVGGIRVTIVSVRI